MKDIQTYLTNKIRNNESSRILLFDVDDTLIHTSAEIGVLKNGKLINKISNSDFNNYTLKSGEEFDFSEFNDPAILDRDIPTKYLTTLRREYNKGTHIGILTARSNCELIHKFLLKKGIDVKKELIFAVNDPKLNLRGSIQERKAEIIRRLSQAGYTTLVFFDDNESNLRAAKELANSKIKVVTVKV